MPLHLPFHLGERLGALALLLVLLAVFTGVSLTQAGLLDDGADALEDVTLPALRQAQDLRRAVDEARGLEALVVLAGDAQQRSTLATQLQRQRALVDGQLSQQAHRPMADAERQLQASVNRQLAVYWASQDKVLALMAGDDPASQLAQARLLLAGDSQAAWRAVGAALDAWQHHHAQRAAELARQSRSQADWLRLAAGLVLGGVCLASLTGMVLHVRRRRHSPASDGVRTAAGLPPAVSGLPETLDRIAVHSRLVALNAAVQAARTGPPTPAEHAERAHLAAEAEALARRCAAAQKGLRLGQPVTRQSVAPSSTLPPPDSLSAEPPDQGAAKAGRAGEPRA